MMGDNLDEQDVYDAASEVVVLRAEVERLKAELASYKADVWNAENLHAWTKMKQEIERLRAELDTYKRLAAGDLPDRPASEDKAIRQGYNPTPAHEWDSFEDEAWSRANDEDHQP